MGSKYGRRKYGVNAYSRWTVRFGEASEMVMPFAWFARMSYDTSLSGELTFYIDIGGGDTMIVAPFWTPDNPDGGFWVPDVPQDGFWVPDVPEPGFWVPIDG